MLKNELKVLTTTTQTLVECVKGTNTTTQARVVNVIAYNPTADTTTYDLTLTDSVGTTVTLRKAKSLAQGAEDVISYTIFMKEGDKLKALASAAAKINVLVNYEPYNGSPSV